MSDDNERIKRILEDAGWPTDEMDIFSGPRVRIESTVYPDGTRMIDVWPLEDEDE